MPTWERECRSLRELSPGRRPNSKSSNTLSLIIIIKQKITFLNFSVADSIHYFKNRFKVFNNKNSDPDHTF